MKFLARILVFTIATTLGVLAGSVSWDFLLRVTDNDLQVCPIDLPNNETRINVTFEGYEEVGKLGGPSLRFKIYNGSFRPLTYSAHSRGGLYPNIQVNGSKVDGHWRCGTGIQTFYLLPGESIEVSVAAYEFTQRPEKTDMVSIGFYLAKAFGDDDGEIYWSEPLTLPEAFRQATLTNR